ncbi:MAG: DegT/DnrJ/EryC1/StrS family aminotransferase [Candidatus Pacearchaeota archaeon]
MKIDFGDLKLNDIARENILSCIKTNWISAGPFVKKFELEWSKLFNYKHSIAMDNGTSSNMACCMTLYDIGAKRGDEIICPALAFAAVGNSIIAAGFKPVFVDIRRETLNINEDKIEEKITSNTRAIMAVHTMGKPCDMDKINDIAKKNNLFVIEDACEAHGAKYKGKFVGHLGDMATFSYYAAHLICCGEGGMVSTNSSKLAGLLESIKSHGRKPGSLYFDHIRFGLNFKMNDLEAAIGLSQIPDFWNIFNKRKENLYYLLNKLKDLEKFAFFNLEEAHEVTCPHAFSIVLKDPKYNLNDLYNFLEENSIMCKRNFGSMPTQHKAFEFLGYKYGDFPEAEYVGSNGLHFGIHQYLTFEDLDYISEKIHKYFERFN